MKNSKSPFADVLRLELAKRGVRSIKEWPIPEAEIKDKRRLLRADIGVKEKKIVIEINGQFFHWSDTFGLDRQAQDEANWKRKMDLLFKMKYKLVVIPEIRGKAKRETVAKLVARDIAEDKFVLDVNWISVGGV